MGFSLSGLWPVQLVTAENRWTKTASQTKLCESEHHWLPAESLETERTTNLKVDKYRTDYRSKKLGNV